MMYVAMGSPDAGALHVSITVLPFDDEDRPIGADGAVDAAPTVRAWIRAAPKHPGSCAACRHRAKSTALAPNSASADDMDTMLMPAGDPTAARDGDVGADPLQPIAKIRTAPDTIRKARFTRFLFEAHGTHASRRRSIHAAL
jgi:hypothetical protein